MRSSILVYAPLTPLRPLTSDPAITNASGAVVALEQSQDLVVVLSDLDVTSLVEEVVY
jgi:hypothetical protein